MRELSREGNDSYRINHKREFIRNGIVTSDDVRTCFEFAFGMTFGKEGAHRDHRSGGQIRRRNGEIFINTFQGKIAEYGFYNYIVEVGGIDIDPPNMDMMQLNEWDSFDIEIGEIRINIKSTKRRGNLLLLETKDWNDKGQYIPNLKSGHSEYDLFVLMRVDPDGEGLMKECGTLYVDEISHDHLEDIILKEHWRTNIVGFITGEELVDDVIGKKHILPKKSILNGYTKMDAENYYVQSGDFHEIDEIFNLIPKDPNNR